VERPKSIHKSVLASFTKSVVAIIIAAIIGIAKIGQTQKSMQKENNVGR
jgi:hypothetical protein